jgi:hypothetical protein
MIDKNPQIIWILKIGKIKKLLDEHFWQFLTDLIFNRDFCLTKRTAKCIMIILWTFFGQIVEH